MSNPPKPTPQPERSLDDLAREMIAAMRANTKASQAFNDAHKAFSDARVALALAMAAKDVHVVVVDGQSYEIRDGLVFIKTAHVVSPESLP